MKTHNFIITRIAITISIFTATQSLAQSPVIFSDKHSQLSNFHCSSSGQSLCAASKLCKNAPQARIWSNGYPGQGIYEICDTTGCQKLSSRFTRDGAFLIVKTDGQSGEKGGAVAFAKIAPTGSYVEVTDIMTYIVVTYGQCVITPDTAKGR